MKFINLNILKAIIKKELQGYFYSPVAYVFIVIFLLSTVGTTFFLGNFFETNQASLEVFFLFHPWLYLFLIPAIGMRLWAEERNTGSIELLLTLPVDIKTAVIAKFIAGWAFISLALLLTFPMIFTVYYLGDPDDALIFTGYLGSILMAGNYLAITCITSSLTRNQVISFVLSVIICFILILLGWGIFNDILNQLFPSWMADAISNFSFTTHFRPLGKGIIDLRDLIYFFSMIIGSLTINTIILESKKAV